MASCSSRQQSRPHGNPVLRELVAVDTLPRVPACQPPSPRAVPRVYSYRRVSRGRAGWAHRQLGPCPQACPGRGQGSRGCAFTGEALSSSFLHVAHPPGPPDVTVSGPPRPQARDRERRPVGHRKTSSLGVKPSYR